MGKEKKVVNGEMVEVEEETPEIEEEEEVEDPSAEGEDLPDEEEEDEEKTEPWMVTEEDAPDDEKLGSMPVAAHIRYKKKKQEALSEREAEIERLKKENEALRNGSFQQEKPPERPKRGDFYDDDEYAEALDKYYDQMTEFRHRQIENQARQSQIQQQYVERMKQSVDEHYQRAEKIVRETGISPDVYRKTDELVRTTVESVMPQIGNVVVDQFITLLGDGSEKVMYYLGRNPSALDKLKGFLAEDRTGMKAALFLGQQKERLMGMKKRPSSAPAPAPDPGGSTPTEPASVKKLKKKYTEAHKKGNVQAAFDAKRAAKQAGIDTSTW